MSVDRATASGFRMAVAMVGQSITVTQRVGSRSYDVATGAEDTNTVATAVNAVICTPTLGSASQSLVEGRGVDICDLSAHLLTEDLPQAIAPGDTITHAGELFHVERVSELHGLAEAHMRRAD